MAGQTIQRRRGTTAEHAIFTGAVGEITIDTIKKTVVVHDGATAGGVPLAKESALSSYVDKANNLSDVASPTAARQNLGVSFVPVRQTVLSGPVDSNGLPNFGGSTGATTVTATGTLVATAANGFGTTGADNRVGSITNPSWTGLSVNGTMYLYLDIAADGTCTTGSTTLAPTYQPGGTYSTTNGQFTFNIQEMVGKVGNGAAAVQTYRVFVGEVTVAAGVVSAISWYALQGRYDSGRFGVAASTTYTKSHNLGVEPTDVQAFIASSGGALAPYIFFFTSAYQGVSLFGLGKTSITARAQANLAGPGSADGLPNTFNEMKIVVRRGW